MFPWIPFLSGEKKRLSDIEYLCIKEFDAKLRKTEGFLSAAGDLATLTASSGKDMYIARANCTFFANSTNTSALADEVVLKINGTIVETAKSSMLADTANRDGVMVHNYEFKNIGHKVAATQIIKLEVITIDSQVDVEGFIECFEEATGDSPQV